MAKPVHVQMTASVQVVVTYGDADSAPRPSTDRAYVSPPSESEEVHQEQEVGFDLKCRIGLPQEGSR